MSQNHTDATEKCDTMVYAPIQNKITQLNAIAYDKYRINYRHIASLGTSKNVEILKRGRGRASGISPWGYVRYYLYLARWRIIDMGTFIQNLGHIEQKMVFY